MEFQGEPDPAEIGWRWYITRIIWLVNSLTADGRTAESRTDDCRTADGILGPQRGLHRGNRRRCTELMA